MRGSYVTTGRTVSPSVKAYDRALTMTSEIVLGSSDEVGGILLGWWEDNGTAVVHDFLSVQDDFSGSNHYVRRHTAAQELLTAVLNREVDPRIGYIGEWHSHPMQTPPSRTDRQSLIDITREHRRPVALVVLAISTNGRCTPFGLIGTPRRRCRVQIDEAKVMRINVEQTNI